MVVEIAEQDDASLHRVKAAFQFGNKRPGPREKIGRCRNPTRIVEATLKLHGQKGIFGTTWQEIAQEADVAIGTVYKHFSHA